MRWKESDIVWQQSEAVDCAVLQAGQAYEEAAGEAWPSPALTAALAKAEGSAGATVKAKIRPAG